MDRQGHAGFAARRDQFLAAAIVTAGLADFGADDYSEGLDLFLNCLDQETTLSPEGAAMTAGQIEMFLVSRLYSEDGWKRRLDAVKKPIIAPLIITGIVRSGTTALHKLLSLDPQFQGLEHWITRAPQPRPPRSLWRDNPAYRKAADVVSTMIDNAPEMQADHMMSAEDVEESIFLLPQTFCSNMMCSQWKIPAYDAWWRRQDETPSYQRFARNLQLIGADAPDQRWLLKNPTDLYAMNAVLNVFPDARIVQTHRDPLFSIPSIASLIAAARRLFEGAQSDPLAVGRRESEFWALALERAAQARLRVQGSVFDIEFTDFVGNQLGTVQALYRHFGLDMTETVEAAMRDWLACHPHRCETASRHYRMEDFGLDAGALAERYVDYRRARGYC